MERENFKVEPPNDELEWGHTPSLLGIVSTSDADVRGRSVDALDREDFRRVRNDSVRAIFESSDGDRDWEVEIRPSKGVMGCECPAFKYGRGPCKHVVAAALHAVSRREGGSPMDWREVAVAESRNAARKLVDKLQKGVSGDHHDPSESEATEHGAELDTVRVGRREITGYRVDGDLLWTGPLPVPEEGDEVLVDFGGDSGPGEGVVAGRYEGDATFLGLRVRLNGPGSETIVFGRDLIEDGGG